MSERAVSGDLIHARRFSLVLTAAAGVVPVVALVGWGAGIPLLASYGKRFIPMAPSTAICFILLLLPLLFALRPAQDPVESTPGKGSTFTLRLPLIHSMTGDRMTILAHGFDNYISKPIDAELLRKTLHEVFHGNK